MKKVFSLALGLLAVVSFQAAANTVKLVNKTGWDLYEIYMSPTSQDNWGEDHLGDQVLETGDSLTLTDVSNGRWDLLIVDMDGDKCTLTNIHITASETVNITGEDLVGCQGAE